jgi:hypothetical protein
MAWPFSAFFLKLLIPAAFFAGPWMIASGANHNFFSVVLLSVFFAPFVGTGVWLLRTGQLRWSAGRIAYRRWFRWQILPLEDIEEIRGDALIGTMKLIGRRKLHFFVEGDNERLLGFKLQDAESLEAWINRPATTYGPDRPILQVLAAIAGLTLVTILPVIPPMPSSPNDWRWLDEYVKFLDRHSSILSGLMLVAVGWRFRETRSRPSERIPLAFMFGAIIGSLVKGAIRGL